MNAIIKNPAIIEEIVIKERIEPKIILISTPKIKLINLINYRINSIMLI